VGCGHHSERTVIHAAVVEVDSNGQHVAEDTGWRTNMSDAGLYRPRPPTIGINSSLDGNKAILMPAYLPIQFRILVEEDSAYGETPLS
jgi:hypothetical protein